MTHISVCVCTFNRRQPLRRLLNALLQQETDGQFTYSIVIADNDHLRSAEDVVSSFAKSSAIPIRYCVEPKQNIARARNKTVENADGDLLAFIDDDEFPTHRWLITLLKAVEEFSVSGALGPVRPVFDSTPPDWVIAGHFHDRPEDRTGVRLNSRKCRTGNALVVRDVFANRPQPFRPECLNGEDQDFFARLINEGHEFVWCNEAVVYEAVPPARWTRQFLWRRSLIRGMFSIRNVATRPPAGLVLRTLVALPVLGLALPVALVWGQAAFMRVACKFSYHTGRLCAFLGLNPLGDPIRRD